MQSKASSTTIQENQTLDQCLIRMKIKTGLWVQIKRLVKQSKWQIIDRQAIILCQS
jgi:hypothetical protein